MMKSRTRGMMAEKGLDRREFLALGGIGLAGIWLAPILGGCDSHTTTPLGSAGESASFITPIDRFFEQNGGEGGIGGWRRPEFASETDWSLTVKSAAGERTVTWNDLVALAAEPDGEVTHLKTIECILQSEIRPTPTGFAGTAYWTGVPLTRVLDSVGLDYSESSPIKALIVEGADRFLNNITTERLRQDNLLPPLLATRMNGEPLPLKHGFPVRLIIQEGYGYKCVKWLTEIEASNFLVDTGTYQSQGFVNDGIIRTNSRGVSIFEDIVLPAGPTRIAGFATSGFAPISRVEISIDGAAPQEARIIPLDELTDGVNLPPTITQITEGRPYPFLGVWTFWDLTWEATSGAHTIAIRAYDAAGNAQPLTDGENEGDERDGLTGVTTYNVEVA